MSGVRSDDRSITTNGTLWTWGYNNAGQLGLGDTATRTVPTRVGSDTDWASVRSGSLHTAAIKLGGTLWTWGENGNGELGLGDTSPRLVPSQVGVATDWVAAAVGNYHTVALRVVQPE